MGITGKSISIVKRKDNSSAAICSRKAENLMWINLHCTEKEIETIRKNIEGFKSK